MEFTKKTAIVTGAASGMGLLFCQNWAALGGNVILCDINEEALRAREAEINAEGKGTAIGMVCDVRNYPQICAVCDRAVEAFGGIDLLVNFAGGTAVRMQKVWPKVESGAVKPTIYKVLPIQEAEVAQDLLYQGKNVGKVVLKV